MEKQKYKRQFQIQKIAIKRYSRSCQLKEVTNLKHWNTYSAIISLSLGRQRWKAGIR
jgi:hypothetical protein